MRKGLIALVLALILLGAGAVLWHTQLSAPSEESVTRMADLGLMLLDSDEGVTVLAVKDKSVADKAGILPGDVLLQADDVSVANILQLEEILLAAQKRMAIQLRRDQEELLTVWLKVR